MAERCLLFITLSLGESILIVGANVGELPGTFVEGSALIVAFTGTIALWWIYFDRIAEAGRHLMSTSADPGRFALSAYTWAHIPMVAGIIVSRVADDLVIEHPRRRRHRGHADHPRRARAVPDRQLLVPVGALGLGAALRDRRADRARRRDPARRAASLACCC